MYQTTTLVMVHCTHTRQDSWPESEQVDYGIVIVVTERQLDSLSLSLCVHNVCYILTLSFLVA